MRGVLSCFGRAMNYVFSTIDIQRRDRENVMSCQCKMDSPLNGLSEALGSRETGVTKETIDSACVSLLLCV
jgi:hypothetical protein